MYLMTKHYTYQVTGYSKSAADKALVEVALDSRTYDAVLEANDKVCTCNM
jgi:hypothetical protein